MARRQVVALLVADLVSTLGSEMAAVALPWFVLVTTGSAARTGAVVAAEFAGIAVFGVPSGRVALRLGARRTMLATDAFSIPVALAVPVLHWSGALSFPVLVAVGLGLGAAFPAHQSSQQLLLAGAVGDVELSLTRAGGLLSAANETASFVGPAVGGVLVASVGSPWVLVADAASFAVSCALVAGFVGRDAAPAHPPVGDAAVVVAPPRTLDGVRYLARTAVLRRRVVGLAIAGISFTALLVTFPVLARQRYDAGATLAGWLLASYGLGSVVGGLVSARARDTSERVFAAAVCVLAVSLWPLVVPLPSWAVAACVAGHGVASGLVYPRLFASLTARPPDRLRAQVLTATTTALSAAAPVGGVVAGLLLQGHRSPEAALVLVAAAVTVGALIAAPPGPSVPADP